MTNSETEYWNAVGREWDRDLPDPLWRKHSDAVNRAMLERWLPEGRVGRILKTDAFDESCGAGLLELLKSRADEVIGMDLSAATLAGARARQRGFKGVGADARQLPFEANCFDVILSNSTLDHFRTRAELEQSLGELHRVLKPGGSLLLTLDNPINPAVAIRNLLPFGLLHRIGLLPYYVGATLRPGRLRRTLELIGFDVREISAVVHCPRALAVRRARRLSRAGDTAKQERFLSRLMAVERLANWPTRFLTGYFSAVRAIKRA